MLDAGPSPTSPREPPQGVHASGAGLLGATHSTPSQLTAESQTLELHFPRLTSILSERAADRGRRRAFGQNMAEDAALDQDFFRLVRAAAQRLDLERRTQLEHALRRSYDRARISEFGKKIETLALELGLSQGRVEDSAAILRTREALQQERQIHLLEQSDLYERYPLLPSRTAEVIKEQERYGVELRQLAEKEAIAISVALRKFFPNFHDAFALLRDRSALELRVVEESFQQRYGKTIIEEFEDVCNRPGFSLLYPTERIRQRAQHVMARDHDAAAADAVVAALLQRGPGAFRRVRDVLREIAPERIASVQQKFDHSAPEALGKYSSIANRFEGVESKIIAALLHGEPALATAHELKALLDREGKGAVGACDLLEALPREKLHAVLTRYQVEFSEDVPTTIAQHPTIPVPLAQRMISFLELNEVPVNAVDLWDPEVAKLPSSRRYLASGVRCAVQRVGKGSVGEWFEGESPETRHILLDDYRAIYKSELLSELAHSQRRRSRLLSETLIREGYLPDEEAMYQCVDGIGTDVVGAKEILKHKRVSEILALDRRFRSLMRERHGKNQGLAERLEQETSGDDWHDLRTLLQGWPETPAGWVERVESTHRHERSGWFRRVDLITREGPVMDRDVKALREYYFAESAKDSLGPDAQKRIELLSRFCLRDMAVFRQTKNAMAGVLANFGGAIASGTTILLAAQAGVHIHSHLWSVGLMVFGVSALARYSIKRALKGDGYSTEEALQDIAFGTVDGIAPMLARFSPSALLKRGLNLSAKIGGKTAVGRISKSFLQQRMLLRPLTEGTLSLALDRVDGPTIAKSFEGELANGMGREARELCSSATCDLAFERALARLTA